MQETTRTGIPLARMASGRVPFNLDNVNRCMCPGCPVQSDSSCVGEKMAMIGPVPLSAIPTANDMPGEYCAAGSAECGDIDTNRPCSCFGCSVYAENSLAGGEPTCYFCREGSSR